MSPMTTLRSAISSLGANKLRTGLALLGIVIGVAAVISTMSVGRGAQEAVTANIESLGTNLLFVRPGEASVGGIFWRSGERDDPDPGRRQRPCGSSFRAFRRSRGP